MLYSSSEELVADNYFSFINDVIGVLSVTLSATAMQFSKPEPFAWIFLFIIVLWSISKGDEYKRIAKRYLEDYKGVFGSVKIFWKMKIYLIGVSMLLSTALGLVNQNVIYTIYSSI